jgi:uncharacterized protein
MSNIQHPGADTDLRSYRNKIQGFDSFRAGIDQRGAVGYLGGLPSLKRVQKESLNVGDTD